VFYLTIRHIVFHFPGLVLVVSKIKVKVKLALEQAMKAQRGSRGIALFFL
jgi:hypothetical protein